MSDVVAELSEQTCAECGYRGKPKRIVYGLPTAETGERAAKGEFWLGGCVVRGDDPLFGCGRCGTPFEGLRHRG